jgi:hypothetical protein
LQLHRLFLFMFDFLLACWPSCLGQFLIFHYCYIWLQYSKVHHDYFFTLPNPLLFYALILVDESNHNWWHTTASAIQKLRKFYQLFFLNIIKCTTQYFWLYNLHKTCRSTFQFQGVCSMDCIWNIIGSKLEVIFSDEPKTIPLFSTILGTEIMCYFHLLLGSRNLSKS